jgi:hypothetical protein
MVLEVFMLDTGRVDYKDLEFAIARAKRLDSNLRRKMQRDLRSKLGGVAKSVAGGVPSTGPLSGMSSRWGTAVGKVKTATGGKANKAIVMLSVSGPGFDRMLSITERAGSRSDGFTPSGMAMISNSPKGGLQERYPLVQGVGGRFVFKAFLEHQDELRRVSLSIIRDFIDDINSKSWGR